MSGDVTNGGLPRPAAPVWCGYLDGWDRALRTANRPYKTRYIYQLAVQQLADYLAGDELPVRDDSVSDAHQHGRRRQLRPRDEER